MTKASLGRTGLVGGGRAWKEMAFEVHSNPNQSRTVNAYKISGTGFFSHFHAGAHPWSHRAQGMAGRMLGRSYRLGISFYVTICPLGLEELSYLLSSFLF